MFASEWIALARLEDFFLSLLTLQAPYEWGWRMHPMWGAGWGFGMMLMMALVWGAIIVVCLLGISWLRRQPRSPAEDAAMSILRQRFARGEIDKDEFDARKRELS